jgi:hypothetical protein
MVTIAGEVKKEKEEKKGEQVVRSERYFGKIERSFSLPQEIDEAGVNAQYVGVGDLDRLLAHQGIEALHRCRITLGRPGHDERVPSW